MIRHTIFHRAGLSLMAALLLASGAQALDIPAGEIAGVYARDGLIAKDRIEEAAERTSQALRSLEGCAKSELLCSVIGAKRLAAISEETWKLALEGAGPDKRMAHAAQALERAVNDAIAGELKAAEQIEEELSAMVERGTLDPEDDEAVLSALSKNKSAIPTLFKLIEISFKGEHYSSIRVATDSGRHRRWFRNIVVVATTASSKLTMYLGGYPMITGTNVSSLVTTTHFRGVCRCIPTQADQITAGASRNGNNQTRSETNRWIVTKPAIFVDTDPDLRNMVYRGTSRDAVGGGGIITLSASGTP